MASLIVAQCMMALRKSGGVAGVAAILRGGPASALRVLASIPGAFREKLRRRVFGDFDDDEAHCRSAERRRCTRTERAFLFTLPLRQRDSSFRSISSLVKGAFPCATRQPMGQFLEGVRKAQLGHSEEARNG
jgi:hypothetical protein